MTHKLDHNEAHEHAGTMADKVAGGLTDGPVTFEQVALFSETWGLVYMVVLFAVVLIYALRPSAKKTFDAAAHIPLRED